MAESRPQDSIHPEIKHKKTHSWYKLYRDRYRQQRAVAHTTKRSRMRGKWGLGFEGARNLEPQTRKFIDKYTTVTVLVHRKGTSAWPTAYGIDPVGPYPALPILVLRAFSPSHWPVLSDLSPTAKTLSHTNTALALGHVAPGSPRTRRSRDGHGTAVTRSPDGRDQATRRP
eukprot:2817577-Rhodomonas_salina.1